MQTAPEIVPGGLVLFMEMFLLLASRLGGLLASRMGCHTVWEALQKVAKTAKSCKKLQKHCKTLQKDCKTLQKPAETVQNTAKHAETVQSWFLGGPRWAPGGSQRGQ